MSGCDEELNNALNMIHMTALHFSTNDKAELGTSPVIFETTWETLPLQRSHSIFAVITTTWN